MTERKGRFTKVNELVLCPVCLNIQLEKHVSGDKFAWQCMDCENLIEDNEVMPIQPTWTRSDDERDSRWHKHKWFKWVDGAWVKR